MDTATTPVIAPGIRLRKGALMAWVEKRGTDFRVRHRTPAGKVVTDSVHPTKTAAKARVAAIRTDQQRDVFVDPNDGKLSFADWAEEWFDAHDVGKATTAKYHTYLNTHILPRFGDIPLNTITRMMIKSWVKDLSRRRAHATVTDILSLLSMILSEAVEDRRIGANPCHKVRLAAAPKVERPWATAEQVHAIAARASTPDATLILTAAYTGMRWGELVGLQRHNCKLDHARILIDPAIGALHEVAGELELGPPKTDAAVRSILLPPSLVVRLRAHLDGHDRDTVFTGRDGGWHRRSNFHRRVWRPATDGDSHTGLPSILAGMHFHDLRHSHKTWLIEDGAPEVAQAKRLGHRLPGVRGIYSHVTPAVEQRLVDGLEIRWRATVGDNNSD